MISNGRRFDYNSRKYTEGPHKEVTKPYTSVSTHDSRRKRSSEGSSSPPFSCRKLWFPELGSVTDTAEHTKSGYET